MVEGLPFVLEGYVEGLSGQNFRGWIWCVGRPDIKPSIYINIDGISLHRSVADIFREDLLGDRKSDGRAGYQFSLPAEIFDGRNHKLELRWELLFDGETYSGVIDSVELACPATLPDPADAPPPSHPSVLMESYFEGVRERTLNGWAWCVDHPSVKPTIDVIVDGERIGSTVASDYRADLQDAGKSDGSVAYSFTLPTHLLDGQYHDIMLTWSVPLDGEVHRGPLLGEPIRIQVPKANRLLEQWLLHRTLPAAGDGGPDLARGSEAASIPQTASTLTLLSRQQPVTVIVHLDEQAELAQTCLDALVAHTSYPCKVVIVDDGTSNARIADLIGFLQARSGMVEVRRNLRPVGFAVSVRQAMADTPGDVVLLSSRVRVTPHWLEGLVRAAAHAADIGIVAPLSNRLAWLGLDEAVIDDALARQLARSSERLLPAGHGFPLDCVFLRRALIDEADPSGAADEPDAEQAARSFFARLTGLQWSSVLADDVLVHVAGTPAMVGGAEEPAHHLLVKRLAGSDAGSQIAHAVAQATKQCGAAIRPRLLYVLSPPDNSGTPLISLSLARWIRDAYEPWFVWGDGDRISLAVMNDAGDVEPVATWKVNATLTPWDLKRGDIDTVLFKILRDFDIALVHCRQVIQLGLSVTRVAQALGVPVILSFHDFYLACPTVTLLDGEGRFCAGHCDKGSGDCRSYFIPEHSLTLRDGWTPAWQRFVASMFRFVDVFVTTTPSAYDVLTGVYPELRQREFRIIEHGRTFPERYGTLAAPSPDRPVKVLALGNYNTAKGLGTVRALAELDQQAPDGARIELHWLGEVPGGIAAVPVGIHHGSYQQDEVLSKIGEIGPDFVLLLSTWAETYCHTLSEAWAAGIPVIGSRLGAIGARIEEHGGGWTVDPHDAAAIRDLILRLSANQKEYRAVSGRIPRIPIRPTEDMAADYLSLYADTVSRRFPLAEAGQSGGPGF
ncbi:glycosyltransferase [Azospirillum palustre]